MSMSDDEFANARQAHLNDVTGLEHMNDEELAYLDGLHEISDPDTDGLECEHGLTEEEPDGG